MKASNPDYPFIVQFDSHDLHRQGAVRDNGDVLAFGDGWGDPGQEDAPGEGANIVDSIAPDRAQSRPTDDGGQIWDRGFPVRSVEYVSGGIYNDVIVTDDSIQIIDARGGDDIIHAGGGDDTAFGGLGDDQIFGDEGDDFIDGGRGSDTMDGGEGADIFHYAAEIYDQGSDAGLDLIVGFELGTDRFLFADNLFYPHGPEALSGRVTAMSEPGGASLLALTIKGWQKLAVLDGIDHADLQAAIDDGSLFVPQPVEGGADDFIFA